MKSYTKLALLGIFVILLLVVVPSALAVKTGNYSNNINMDRGTDGTLVITVEPGTSSCGNEILQTAYGEQCDGAVSFSCSNLDSSWTGDLSCKSDCTYDTSGCSAIEATPEPNNGGGSSGGGGRSSGGGSSGSSTDATRCIENWKCGEWSACEDGNEIRNCIDVNYCGVEKVKPVTVRGCSVANVDVSDQKTGFFNSLFTGAVIGNLGTKGLVGIGLLIVVLLGGLLFVMSKKKKGKKK